MVASELQVALLQHQRPAEGVRNHVGLNRVNNPPGRPAGPLLSLSLCGTE